MTVHCPPKTLPSFHVSVSHSHRHLMDFNPIALKALNSIAGQSTFELLVELHEAVIGPF